MSSARFAERKRCLRFKLVVDVCRPFTQRGFMKFAFFALLLLICGEMLISSQPSAQEPHAFSSSSGDAFVRSCSVVEQDEKQTAQEIRQTAACVGYLAGIVDGVSEEVAFAHAVTDKEPPKPFCLLKNVENTQLVSVTLTYIRNHPEEAHKSAAFLIAKSLREAFPCGTSRR